MNYQKIYDDICKRGQNRSKIDGAYMETHHIVPKCIGGTDIGSNLTLLTAKEHFICHYILAFKLYPNNYKLAHAVFSMSHQINGLQKRYIPGARTYSIIREHSIILMKEHKKNNPPVGDKNGMHGRNHTQESKNKMSKSIKENGNRIGKKHSDETKRKMSEIRNAKISSGEIKVIGYPGRKVSIDTIEKQKETRRKNLLSGKTSYSMLGKHHSDETRAKWKISRAGKQVGSKNNNAKKVKCNETNMEFGCVKDTAEYYNITGYVVRQRIKKGLLSYTK